MSYSFPPELAQLVMRQMASGKYASEDELLREALLALDEEHDDLAAVEAALAAWKAGDQGLPLDVAFAEVRRSSGVGGSP